ncbi:MAG: ABC transporter ATP-binding protein [Candidatus Methanoplasma sp.]|jgi:putative ABC transport system ATP-binding protein|nr:ABC transporter ATP-binding protein [Candidatus Methanoplasma sp.]
MSVVETESLTKVYSGGVRPFSAVSGVDFTINEEDFISVMGRSGSGKSTLLNLVAGLLRPTSGSVSINGRKISELDDRSGSFVRNSEIGYVPQGQSLLGNITVIENVVLPFTLFKRPGEPYGRAKDLLERVGVGDLADSRPKNLSGGEQRRVSVARALMNSPSLLIADEPTSDLDLETSSQVMELFSEINREGAAVLMVTHEPDTANYGNRHFTMDAGKLTERTA